MSRGDYPKTNLRFPVMGTDGIFHDVFGYLECYWDCDFFFFHMPDGGAVVYKIGDTGYKNSYIPVFNTWAEVAEQWLPDQKERWGERRYNENFCPPVALEGSLAGWRIAYDNAYEYTAFSDDGKVICVDFHRGKIVSRYTIPGNGTIRYYFPSLLETFITEDGFLRSRYKDFTFLGKLNLEATLNCQGGYFIMEDGTTYDNASLYNNIHKADTPLSKPYKCFNGFIGSEYAALHYYDNTVDIFTTKIKKFGPLKEKDIRKAVFTESHILFLYNDGHVSYHGQNKNRSCSGLDKYTNVRDIWGTENTTTLLLESGEKIHIPKK